MRIILPFFSALFNFLRDYCARHSHPLNACLHLLGVPLAFFGLYKLFDFRPAQKSLGLSCLILGYLLQYLGHKKQGNEVGEVTLIKRLLTKTGLKADPSAAKIEESGNAVNGNGHRGSYIRE